MLDKLQFSKTELENAQKMMDKLKADKKQLLAKNKNKNTLNM